MIVKAWSEKVIIPTYEVGKAEKKPIFLEKRVYQGSSGSVYPYPVIEKISDTKTDKEWQACFLENDYLKIMVLPELGGRVQQAYDKIKERHFIYCNEVIKPALVGLAGPWISGGIEFNWPQHHRPGTYEAVDYTIEENTDGSKTVWCSEIERMSRTKGMAGFTLHPDKAYLEIKVKLYNRTSQPQSFLWWANPAVAVNDEYQSVFPPDVNAVFDHGKRDVSKFPVATGTYYKVDYSRGVDISRYKNIPVPTSYMAIRSEYNFVGGYENDSKGGVLHVANHHISPGKKQWTWGNGDFGRAWDRNLTDINGPYIELMCGVYTDNQPDFSWLMPYEEKTFSQYFMPYRDLGVVKNASKDAMLNIELSDNKAIIQVYCTGSYSGVSINLLSKDNILLEEQYDFSPKVTYLKEIDIDENFDRQSYSLSVTDNTGKLLIDYKPEKDEIKPIPEPAKPAKDPKDILSIEELYLNGLHLEQYRHATYNPTDYYKEALKRDPNDIRCNNALGMWLFRRGKFADAEKYFNKAFQTQTQRNPNPYNGEPLFNLGLSLRMQGKDNEAYNAFYKSVWNAAYMDSGYFQIAQIDAKRGNWDDALDTINRSLIRNWHNHKARHLKVAILRKKEHYNEANILIEQSLELDKFNFGLYFEQYLMGNNDALTHLISLMRNYSHNYIEIALDYADAGMYSEAIELIDISIENQENIYPMILYFKAWFLAELGDKNLAKRIISQAEQCNTDFCFPNRIEATRVLKTAIQLCPNSSKALYYLGNFWYNARQYIEALQCWEKSIEIDNSFPTVHRNLALAYYNKLNLPEKALEALEKAYNLDKTDARVVMELDQLYKKMNKSLDFRMDFLDKHIEQVEERDDLYIERVYLHLFKHDYHAAYELIMDRQFHPWEGGEGKVTGAYTRSLIGMAKAEIKNMNFQKAIEYLEQAKEFPHNLGEGKLAGAQENEIDYWLGCAYSGLDLTEEAMQSWECASKGISEPSAAWFYNDQQPDTIFYQGLALLKLGKIHEANSRFNNLIDYGEQHIFDNVKIDYFAVSLPDLLIWDEDLGIRNKKHCYFLMALGYMGKSMHDKANQYFKKVLQDDNLHAGAIFHTNY